MNLPKLQAMLDAAEDGIKTTGGLSHEDVWNSVAHETAPQMEETRIMPQHNRTLTKVLALAGTLLVWFPILLPALLSLAIFLQARQFHFDYLMPAEFFPVVLAGGALLLWAAWRARLHRRPIAWSLGIAFGVLAAGMVLATTSGLASGETEPTGIWGTIALASILIYSAAVLWLAVSGARLVRDLYF
jgi:cation transport ATPase